MRPPNRRTVLLGLATSALWAGCRASRGSDPRVDGALQRAQSWLWAQQAADGGFPSATYGFFRRGQSTTPFVVDSLLVAGSTHAAGLKSAADRMLQLRDSSGATGLLDPAPDYPVYATALTLSCLGRLDPSKAEPSARWLLSQQLRARDGWADHSACGGWPMGGRQPPTPPRAGHVDLSMTRRALQALQGRLQEGADEARAFVLRCSGADGGFVYSPASRELNKGLAPDAGYGSATCDGILALLALGATDDAQSALPFLHRLHRVDRNPGLEGGRMEAFGTAMRGYYRAASAEVFARLEGPSGWRESLVDAVLAEQAEDGSWRNESPLQKEDDPLVATGFAVQALGWATRR